MSICIENSTRFFAVVGAAYIPEHHFDDLSDNVERGASPRFGIGVNVSCGSDSTGWWPQDDPHLCPSVGCG